MKKLSKRITVYIDPEIHKLLKFRALEDSKSVSELIYEAVRNEFREDLEDLQAFEDTKSEETISLEEFLKELKKDGKI